MSVAGALGKLSDTQYRTARVRTKDGRVARVRVPKNASPQDVVVMAEKVIPKEPKREEKPTSFWQGVGEGLQKPIANTARMFEDMPLVGTPLRMAGAVMNTLSGNGLVPSMALPFEAASRKAIEKSPYQGSTAGRIAGGVLGTLPTAAMPAGAIAQGVTSGLLMTENLDDPKTALRDAAIGGVMGKAGDVAGKAIGKGISRAVGGRAATQAIKAAPKTPKDAAYQQAVKTLSDADVLMTPGQRAGGFARKMEDAVDTLGTISQYTPMGSAKEGALVDMNRAAYNEVLKPLGITLKRSVTPGREALRNLDDAVGMAYEKAAAPLKLQVDDALTARLGSYVDDALARMGPDDAAQLDANIAKIVSWRQRAEPLSGKEVSRFLGDMRKVASNARTQGKQELADSLWSMHDDIENAALAQSAPGAVGPFKKAREAVRRFKILEDAGAKTNDGLVTPGQFKTATHKLGYGNTRNRLTRGEAPMQELADAASLVLPDKLGNSGSAERAGLLSLLSGGTIFGAGSAVGVPVPAAGVLGAGSMAYTPAVNRFMQYGRRLPAGRVDVGEVIARNTPALGRGSAGLLSVAGLYPFLSQEIEPLP